VRNVLSQEFAAGDTLNLWSCNLARLNVGDEFILDVLCFGPRGGLALECFNGTQAFLLFPLLTI
jgi:hypothetical protein